MRSTTHSWLRYVVPLLVVACASSQLRPPPLAPRIAADSATPSSQVYAVVLDAFHDSIGAALVRDSTRAVTPGLAERLDSWLENRFTTETPDGFDEAIEDFRRHRQSRLPITPIPVLQARVAYITDAFAARARADGGRSLHEWFKCAPWPPVCTFLHSFTAVGFNPDSTQAVLYHESWCSGLCASDVLLFLQRRPPGPWTITKKVILGMS